MDLSMVDIKFDIDKNLSDLEKKTIIIDIANEINDRFMCVHEIKLDGVEIFNDKDGWNR